MLTFFANLGNCLFNALSDQLYGHQNEHQAVRSKVIAYMREHAFYYKQFIDVHPGGWVRRNPKRKNAGTYASPVNLAPPSQAEIDRVFESHLQNMAKGGTYGDNMEITAFSSAFDVNVKIYQRDFAYMVSGSEGSDDSRKSVAHIAYHVGEVEPSYTVNTLLTIYFLNLSSPGSITHPFVTLMGLIPGCPKFV